MRKRSACPCPSSGIARSEDEAFAVAERIGYPVIVRPSYVLGGRAMAIVYMTAEQLEHYIRSAVKVAEDTPILIDRFLEDAFRDGRGLRERWARRAHRRHHGADRADRRALGR
jgi:biotin carboxylase